MSHIGADSTFTVIDQHAITIPANEQYAYFNGPDIVFHEMLWHAGGPHVHCRLNLDHPRANAVTYGPIDAHGQYQFIVQGATKDRPRPKQYDERLYFLDKITLECAKDNAEEVSVHELVDAVHTFLVFAPSSPTAMPLPERYP